jgi:hypothetical protein
MAVQPFRVGDGSGRVRLYYLVNRVVVFFIIVNMRPQITNYLTTRRVLTYFSKCFGRVLKMQKKPNLKAGHRIYCK